MSQKKVMKLATRGKRFGAGMIDVVPMVILYVTMWILLMRKMVLVVESSLYGAYGMSGNAFGYTPNTSMIDAGTVFVFLLMFAYMGVQFYFFTRSQTIGKAITGLRVVDNRTGKPIGFAKMLLRELIVKQGSKAVFCMGYIWILIDKYNRAWHDMILDTYVVDEAASRTLNAYDAQPGTSDESVEDTDEKRAQVYRNLNDRVTAVKTPSEVAPAAPVMPEERETDAPKVIQAEEPTVLRNPVIKVEPKPVVKVEAQPIVPVEIEEVDPETVVTDVESTTLPNVFEMPQQPAESDTSN